MPIPALKLYPKHVKNLDQATSVEGYGDRVITDEYGNFIPTSKVYENGITNSSGNMEGFIPEVLVTPKYSIKKEDLKPKLYFGNVENHPDAKYMSNAYLDAQIQKAKNIEEADRRAGEVDPLTMLNLASAGTANYMFSPTQTIRLGIDLANGKGEDYLKGQFFEGNNGIVSDNFAQEHPYWSMAINAVGDTAAFGLGSYAKSLANPIARQTAFYRQITPLGYGNTAPIQALSRKQEIGKFFKDWALYPLDPNRRTFTREWLKRIPDKQLNPNQPLLPIVEFRDDAIRLSLGLPQRNNIYVKNLDGTFSYNLAEVDKVKARFRKNIHLSGMQSELRPIKVGESKVIGDRITGNGGFINAKRINPTTVEITDVWDLQPFKDDRSLFANNRLLRQINKIPAVKNFEVIKFLGREPFALKQQLYSPQVIN